MRIGIDGRALQPGYKGHAQRGIGSYTRALSGALPGAAEDDRLTLLLDDRRPTPDGLAASFERRYLRSPGAPFLRRPIVANGFFLRRGLGRIPADLFFFPFHEDAPLRAPGRPTVVIVHDCIPYLREDFYGAGRFRIGIKTAYARAVFRYARIVTISESTKRDLGRLFPVDGDAIPVIPPGLDPAFAPPDPEAVDGYRRRAGLAAPYVLALGGSDPRKNNVRAVRAWAEARRDAASDTDLVIVGSRESDAWERPLTRAIESSGSAGAVRRIERVDPGDLPLLYAGAAALLFVSLYEGFGLPPLEAMGCGTPVVASNATSVPEVVGDAAASVDPRDIGDIASALASILGDPDHASRLSARGRKRAASFSWAGCASRLHGFFQEILRAAP